jgi:hypothetical protein
MAQPVTPAPRPATSGGPAALALGGAVVACGALASLRARALERLHTAESQASQLAVPTPVPAAPKAEDFTRTLPAPPTALRVVGELQRASSTAGVMLLSLSAQEHTATVAQLGRMEFDVTLRGPYPALKLVLRETLARWGGSTVKVLRLRQEPAAPQAEMQVVLAVWSAPAR